jgi:hypothetical protein
MSNLLNFGKGTAVDEQDFVTNIINFAVGICGWQIVSVYSDTAVLKGVCLKSSGTQPGRFGDLYAVYWGQSNTLGVDCCTRWVSISDKDGSIYNASYHLTPCAGSTFNWYGIGDEDGIWFLWDSGGSYYSCYVGYLETYYSDELYNSCGSAIGQANVAYFFDENRTRAHYPYIDKYTTTSGAGIELYTNRVIYSNMLQYSDPSNRDGTSQGQWPFIMACTTAGKRAIVGELRHCLWFPGTTLTTGAWYTISGTNFKYLIQKYSGDNAETVGFGPILVSSGTSW